MYFIIIAENIYLQNNSAEKSYSHIIGIWYM